MSGERLGRAVAVVLIAVEVLAIAKGDTTAAATAAPLATLAAGYLFSDRVHKRNDRD